MKKVYFCLIFIVFSLFVSASSFAAEYDVTPIFEYDNVVSLSDVRSDDRFIYIKNSDETLAVFNSDFQTVTNGEYLYTDSSFHDGILRVSVADGDGNLYYGGIDESGNLVIDTAYTELGEFEGGKALGILFGQTVMINTRGEIMHTYGWTHGFFSKFVNGVAFVRDEPMARGECFINFDEVSVTDISYESQDYPNKHEVELRENAERYRDGFYVINEDGERLFDNLTAETEIINASTGSYGVWDSPYRYHCNVIVKSLNFNENFIAVAKRGDRYGLINIYGGMLTNFIFRDYNYDEDNNRILLFGAEPDEEGYVTYCFDLCGNLIYKNSYNYGELYERDNAELGEIAAIVEENGKFGVVDGNNNIVIPIAYEKIESYRDTEFFKVWNNGKFGFRRVNENDDFISTSYDDVKAYVIPEAMKQNLGEVFCVCRGDKWGIIDANENVIVPIIYDEIDDGYYENYIICVSDGKSGVIDSFGKVLIEPKYDSKDFGFSVNDDCLFIYNSNKMSIYDIKTGETVDTEYERCSTSYRRENKKILEAGSYGNALVEKCGKFGLVNISSYSELADADVPIWFDDAYEIRINNNTQSENDEQEPPEDYLAYVVKIGKKYGIVNRYSEAVVPIEYDWISPADRNRILAIKDGLCGVFDYDFKVVVPFEYERIGSDMYKGYDYACKNNKCGIIDYNNNILVPIEYDFNYDNRWDSVSFNGAYAYGTIGGRVYQYNVDTKEFIEIDSEYFRANENCIALDGRRCINWDGTAYEKPVHDMVVDYNTEVFGKIVRTGTYVLDIRSAKYFDNNENLIYYSENGKTYNSDGNIVSENTLEVSVEKSYIHPFGDETLFWASVNGAESVAIIRVIKTE